MKYNPVSMRLFASTAAVLAMLSVGYIPQVHAEENVNGSVGGETSKLPITAESLEAYTLVTLNRIYFQYDQSALNPAEKVTLDVLVSRFSRTTESVIELRGYTDGMESAGHQTALGTKRSQTIADYLTSRGIPPQSILL